MLLVAGMRAVHSMHPSVIYSFGARLVVLTIKSLLLVDSAGRRSNTLSSYLLQGQAGHFRKWEDLRLNSLHR